jgi:cyclase
MVKKRLVACLLWRDGVIIQSVKFQHTNIIGDAQTAVDFFNVWGVDEIVLLDVSRNDSNQDEFRKVLKDLSTRCFVPLTVGGWVQTLEDFRKLLSIGADKISINTKATINPKFVTDASNRFGSQCVTVSIDVKKTSNGYEVVSDRGQDSTGIQPAVWAKRVEELGAGEIFLTSIDKDGSQSGYDLDLIKSVSDAVSVPVVASGGVGRWKHLVDGIVKGGADAVSVANRLHHVQHSTKKAKDHLQSAGIDVREPSFAERYDIK